MTVYPLSIPIRYIAALRMGKRVQNATLQARVEPASFSYSLILLKAMRRASVRGDHEAADRYRQQLLALPGFKK